MLLLTLLSNISLTLFPQSQNDSGKATGEIGNQLNRLAKKTPSVQYYFFNSDSILYSYYKGFASISDNRQVDDSTTYNAFSVTKTFTALAVLQLAEQGKVDINQPVVSYLPDFPYGKDITIKQVLNHAAGIPNPIPLSWIHLASEHSDFDYNSFFDDITSKHPKVKSEPNKKYRYSNIGYLLLGQLVEEVSGMSYDSYVKENIIEKLGLSENDLSFTIANEANHAVGYHKKCSATNLLLGMFINKSKYMGKSEKGWKPFHSFYVNGISYGGLVGKPSAFIAYLQELLKHNSAVVSDGIKQQLFEKNSINTGKKTGMCLAWFKGSLNGETYYAHAGGGGGYYCEIRLYPNLGKGSVIFFNRTGMSDERILDKLDRYIIR